jgi:hypothetical protein
MRILDTKIMQIHADPDHNTALHLTFLQQLGPCMSEAGFKCTMVLLRYSSMKIERPNFVGPLSALGGNLRY